MSKKSVLDMTKMFESNQNFRPMRMKPTAPPPSSKLSSRAESSLVPSSPQQSIDEKHSETALNEENVNHKLNFIRKPRQLNKAKPSSLQFLSNASSVKMETTESKENEQVLLFTDKTNFNGSEVDDYEKRKQHAMQIEQILKPELLIDRKLFPETRTIEKKDALNISNTNLDLELQHKDSVEEQLKKEIRSLRNELDETRSELARVQINFSSFEIESRQALQKQTIEMEKLRKKLIFIMKKGFLAQIDSSSTFIGNSTSGYDSTKPVTNDALCGHISRPRTRKSANQNNDSSVDENDVDDSLSFNKRKSTDLEEEGVIKF